MGGCVATARRHSLLSLPRLLVNYNKLRVPRSGTYTMKPTASCEAAQLWVSDRYVSPRDTALTDIIICYGRLRGYGETP